MIGVLRGDENGRRPRQLGVSVDEPDTPVVRDFFAPRSSKIDVVPRGPALVATLPSRFVQTIEEVADEQRDLIGCFVEREMPRLDKVNFRLGHIVRIGCRAGDGE